MREKILTIGENMKIRRFARYEGEVVTYSHGGGNVLVVSSELAVQLLAEALGSSEKAVALKNADVVHITFDGDVFTVHPQ